jgi:membrane associated rhomboid family serine protease
MDDETPGRRYSSTGRKNAGYSRRPARERRYVQGPGPDATQLLGAIIAVNVAVFVLWNLTVQSPVGAILRANLTVQAAAVVAQPWTLLTYGFSHYDTSHLLFNMFGLWVFGRPVMERYGWQDLVLLYVGAVVFGGLAHVATSPAPALGASAAVMAVSVVYGLTYPNSVLRLWFFLPMPAWLAVVLFVGLDLMGMVGPGDGIAHAAHLGGAAFGAAMWAWRNPQRWRGR